MSSFPPLARDLQLWPELVEIGSEVHTGRRSSLYTAVFQGQRVVFKVSTEPFNLIIGKGCLIGMYRGNSTYIFTLY